jgi:SAM-dependent methyltransferase
MSNDLQKVSAHWSKTEPGGISSNFYMSDYLRSYIIETAYGPEQADSYRLDIDFAEKLFVSTYLQDNPVESILSLCCGFGKVERAIVAQLQGVKYCLGLDIADGALAIARTRAREERLNQLVYQKADLNGYTWEVEKYDLVIANGALHHLSNLEGVLEGIHRTLKPNGLLYACEYVGPSYMNHPPRQVQIINAAANLLPPELREKRLPPVTRFARLNRIIAKAFFVSDLQNHNPAWPSWKKGIARLLGRVWREDPEVPELAAVYIPQPTKLMQTDPSECVRSAEIIPVVKRFFPSVEVRPFGGGILMHALGKNFYAKYDENKPIHRQGLDLLFRLERHFMETGEIGMENAFIIARKL